MKKRIERAAQNINYSIDSIFNIFEYAQIEPVVAKGKNGELGELCKFIEMLKAKEYIKPDEGNNYIFNIKDNWTAEEMRNLYEQAHTIQREIRRCRHAGIQMYGTEFDTAFVYLCDSFLALADCYPKSEDEQDREYKSTTSTAYIMPILKLAAVDYPAIIIRINELEKEVAALREIKKQIRSKEKFFQEEEFELPKYDSGNYYKPF